jgi:hypothetical protein
MKYITVKTHNGNAGIGHRFANFIVPLILAKKYGLKYIYQSIVEKDESHIHQMAPIKKWNDFLNFGENELTINDLPKQIHHAIRFPLIESKTAIWNHPIYQTILADKKFNQENMLYRISDEGDGQFIEIDWEFYKNNNLKIKYNNSSLVKNFENYFSKDYLNCAIHIRREDITKNTQHNRWKSLDYYLLIISNLNKIKFNKPIMYHIYSSYMPEEEKNILLLPEIFDKNPVKLHINEDIFSTFYHFTKANIFISGQGSFSLMANYLTDAVKLTTPWFFHWNNFPKDIRDIIEINSSSSFDKNKLMEAMV